jgi:hypothetical protein
MDRQAQSVFNKMSEQIPGEIATPKSYRVSGNHYQFQCTVRATGMAPGSRAQAPYNQTFDVYLNPDGSVEMR